MSYFALIPAAGSGARLAGERSKQYRSLAGRTMLWHSLRAVLRPPIETVFVVLAAGDSDYAGEDWSGLGESGNRVEPLYCGGATRAESVHNGLVVAMAEVQPDDWMLVHDAARPCLPARDLAALVAECRADAVGGILALPVADTVKRGAKDEAGSVRVAATEDRQMLWLAQTPQMFRAALLVQALRAAGSAVTDEAAAIEALGLRPRLVAGSRENIKVTWA